jgi:hypothetical protein
VIYSKKTKATPRKKCSITVMAGLVPAIHVAGANISSRPSRLSRVMRQYGAKRFHLLSWTTWMAGTGPAMTAAIDSII